MHYLGELVKEKECWTLAGRKKIYLVDDNNKVIKELKDLGPLSEMEMKWVKSNCGIPYREWLKIQSEENDAEQVASE
jgi:hypothetical protein